MNKPAPNHAQSQAQQQALQALLASVHAEPWAHDFFALLRRIDALRPQAPRTGQASRPTQEVLRMGQVPELDFAPAALASLEMRGGLPPRLGVRFFGLLGPQGAMPLHFTEYVRERAHQHGDATLTHFLNLFHHRLLSLFYRAWAQAQPTVHLDRAHCGNDDRYTAWLSSAAGLPNAGDALAPAALAFHAGQLANRTRHPEALCKVLTQYFGVPVALQAHVGQWLAICPQDHSRLGFAANRVERSQMPMATLGRAANAGHKVWDRQYKFRLLLGPLSLTQYQSYLPAGSAFAALLAWVKALSGADLRWDLQLSLRPQERPAPRLGKVVQLGLTTWLGRRPPLPSVAPSRPLLRLRPATNFLVRRLGASHV
jgi:type VI secretion system protein ImpH